MSCRYWRLIADRLHRHGSPVEPLRQVVSSVGQADRGFHHLAEPLYRDQVAITKGICLAGKKFEDTENFVVVNDGHHHHGGNPQLAAYIAVHAVIPFGIIAAQGFASAHAFAGEAKFCR